VTSFGYDELIISRYEHYIEGPHRSAKRKAHGIAVIFGISQGLVYMVFALLFWAGMRFILRDPVGNSGEDVMMATMVLMFGAFAAGQANQYGPDVGKAKKAAVKIFGYIDKPSKINAVDIPDSAIPVPSQLKGEIEFRDVWFRYPTRKNEWVFKGLNLKLRPNESVAIVGESGCGKSTLVNLVMRFYDPCHGEVLIDGINIKEYNLKELRERMGLVMQEPTLFNYTIKENILYGKSQGKNSEVREAAATANALEFIESQALLHTVDDNPTILLQVLRDRREEFLDFVSEDELKQMVDKLEFIEKKLKKEGQFQSVKNITDRRDKSLFDLDLHDGFGIDCGLRGGKLSGGQKQRIAIARAIIRHPQMLILDEATSALDEDSQKKVQVALEQIMDNRTSIVIAHRLTTVEKCKRIVVLESGVVVEDGTFDNLTNQTDGHFAKLQKQMKKEARKVSRKKSLEKRGSRYSNRGS